MKKIVHIDHLLLDYLEGTLTRAQIEKVKSHLVFCRACRLTLEDLEKNEESRKQRKEKTQIKKPLSMPLRGSSILKIGAAAAAVLVVVVLLKNIERSAPTREPSPLESTSVDPPAVVAPVVPFPTPEPTPPPEPTAVDIQGDHSGIEETRELIIKTEKEWENVWKNHVKNQVPSPPAPVVDFDQNDVLVVFTGTQSSGGHSVKIGKIEETTWNGAPARIVHYTASGPAAGTMNTMALTQPFHMKTAPKHAGRTFFRKNR